MQSVIHVDQIEKHTKPNSLKFCIYHGASRQVREETKRERGAERKEKERREKEERGG